MFFLAKMLAPQKKGCDLVIHGISLMANHDAFHEIGTLYMFL